MPPSPSATMESLVPVLRYRDVAAAAAWLETAFGFERKTLINASEGGAIYAELVHGRGTIMLVPVGQSDLDAHMRQPDELGGIETQTCYVTVSDADAHQERAVDGGADIVLPLSGVSANQRGYSCRDLEGHIWNFGTYEPVAGGVIAAPGAVARRANEEAARTSPSHRMVPALTLALVGLAVWTWTMPDNPLASTAKSLMSRTAGTAPANSMSESVARSEAERQADRRQSQETILKLRQEVAEARRSLKAAQDAANVATKDLAAEYARRTQAENGSGDAGARLANAEANLASTKAALANLESELLKERSARGQSVLAADAARSELAQESKKREHLERLVDELDRKADDRLQMSLGAARKPAQDPPASSAAVPAPPETGSVGPAAKPATMPPLNPAETGKAAGEKANPVTAKRAKPSTQKSIAASKKPVAKSGDDKQWPFSSW